MSTKCSFLTERCWQGAGERLWDERWEKISLTLAQYITFTSNIQCLEKNDHDDPSTFLESSHIFSYTSSYMLKVERWVQHFFCRWPHAATYTLLIGNYWKKMLALRKKHLWTWALLAYCGDSWLTMTTIRFCVFLHFYLKKERFSLTSPLTFVSGLGCNYFNLSQRSLLDCFFFF